jgi:pimeloyl-ACP methyl ester carboxylesterase
MNLAYAVRLFSWLIVVAQLSGCASPSQRMDDRAADLGYRRVVVRGDGFSHVAYIKEGRATPNTALHVYLEGDGTPWVHKHVAASDPTPRTPLMLELMSLDPAPSLYLGRPCYNGLNKAKACTPDVWTDRRYSEAVVASMSAALDRLSSDYQALVLLGYSGGGTLAMLLAERQPKTETVITVAANLDTERWAALHKQQPLTGSLNPATRPPLPPRIRQMHFAGAEDDNVPPLLVRDAIAQQLGATFKVFPKQDHSCCWRDVWKEILGGLTAD